MRGGVLVRIAAVVLCGCSSSDEVVTASTTTVPVTTTTAAAATTLPAPIDESVAARLSAVFADVDPAGPGCSAALSQDGAVVWAEGFGLADVEAGRPIDLATRFDIGSTSKQFTATAILLLEADGEIDGDMALSDVLYELPAWAQDVTIDDLVHHTSGIPDYIDLLGDEGFSDTDRTTQEDAVDTLMGVDELDFDPGSDWEYSNSNYLLMAEVVHRITDTPLPQFLDRRVFAPLGLAMVMDPVGDVPGKAISYERSDGGWEPQTSGWEQVGDGAIQTTPSELVRWATQYWEPTLGGSAVLAARTAGAAAIGDGTQYGAGIVVDGAQLLHDGYWLAFVTELIIQPQSRAAAAVTCNHVDAHGPEPTALAQALLDVWGTR